MNLKKKYLYTFNLTTKFCQSDSKTLHFVEFIFPTNKVHEFTIKQNSKQIKRQMVQISDTNVTTNIVI